MLAYRRCVITFYSLCIVYYVTGQHEKESKFGDIVKRTVIATAHTCMDHVNATEKDLEYLRGDPPFPEKSACIITCLLEKVGVVKNNKYSKFGFMTAVTPLVFTNRKKLEHMKTVSENCDREVNHKQETPCQLGNEVTTCIFKYAPELHFKS
ncbi:uncharacterized protein LOC110381536 [Helicoverpa armigera]|uniref:Uncharacterized protein n=1 Tax=Helicoverpa armigera TaxID=29058 RepID=A0A2W1BAR4_HELAM|nr:uncharacterized protein LOC110381536 [Helicoverpa armigera]PZC72462.1 hypothetical protein B5X24_HaOG200881 [Helicoverpa armigera]